MSGEYRHEVRVLVCRQCSAPYEAGPGSGSYSCRACGTTSVLEPRREKADLEAAAQRLARGESEVVRLNRLRQQDGQAYKPPSGLGEYVVFGGLDPARADEAMERWQRERKGTSLASAERFFFLTLLLAVHLGKGGDLALQRATLESALESLSDPLHKQVLRSMLARAAARAGDLVAAEAWLAPCDPRSDVLDIDTAYRHGRAVIDTVRGDYRAVLALLGDEPEEIPVADSQDEILGVLRANAHERLGDVERAVEQLSGIAKGGRFTAVASIVAANDVLDLVPESLDRARQRAATARRGRRPGVGGLLGSGCFGCSFLFGAIPFFAFGGISAVQLLIGRPVARGFDMPGAFAVVFPLCGILFGLIGLAALVAGVSSWRLRRVGVPAMAQVVRVESLPMKINDQPVVKLTLRVQLEGHDPYEVEHRTAWPEHQLAALRPGVGIPVLADPGNKRRVVVDSG